MTDGSTTATGRYQEASNAKPYTPATPGYQVQHGAGGDLYTNLSPLQKFQFGRNVGGKFTVVTQDDQVVYTEGHPNRLPMT
jgi:hypothetical protein